MMTVMIMRTVYVDVLMTVNFFIDVMLLYAAAQLLRLRVRLRRLIAAGIAGGVCSLAALLPTVPAALNLLLDAGIAALLVLIAFGKAEPRQFLRRTALMFCVSFFFCGIMMFVITVFKPKGAVVSNDVVYFNISPVVLILLTLLCYYLMRLLRLLTNGKSGNRVCVVKVTLSGAAPEFRALADTGCDVREPFSGKAVIIAERSLIPEQAVDPGRIRMIPFNSLGGEGVLRGIPAESVQIDGREVGKGVYIGLCDGLLKGDVKAIVPYLLLK